MVEHLIIETSELRKNYDGVEALRGLDLQVSAGCICGFLGRNGAGKTTTIKVLLGMAHPTSGVARLFGAAPDAEVRRRVGFVSEEKDLYGYMSVDDMIRFTASFFPRWRGDLQHRYLAKFELPLHRNVSELSRGMRTKLALLLALCRGAELLILDEPRSGLDPAMADEVLQAIVSHVANEEMTVFFSSHQIAEVEQIADRVVIIHRGRTVIAGAIDDLREKYCRVQIVFPNDPPATFRANGVERVKRKGRVLSVWSSAGGDDVEAEAMTLGATSVDVIPVTLKEIFLESVSEEE